MSENKDFENEELSQNENQSSEIIEDKEIINETEAQPDEPKPESEQFTSYHENTEARFDSRNTQSPYNGGASYYGTQNGYNNGYGNGGGYYQPWQQPSVPPRKKKRENGGIIALCVILAVLLIGSLALVGYIYSEYLVPIFEKLENGDGGSDGSGGGSGSGDGGSGAGEGGSGSGDSITDENFNIDQNITPGAKYTSLADAYEATHKSFVEINVVTESGGSVGAGAGSGVIFAKMSNNSGYYILTNNHVVEDATEITVKAYCGDEYKEYKANTAVLTDELTDLAVIVISETEELQVATIGKSSNVRVGEAIYVIGNPLGTLAGTLTNGIISAQAVEIFVGEHNMTLMQTNCAINPGNSGGPMFNMSGEVVGIVNAKYSDVSVEGIGFAIPIDLAVDIASQMISKGYVEGRHNLGISVEYGTYGAGLWITTIEVESALRDTDLTIQNTYAYRIESINGVTFESTAAANRYIDEQLKAGDTVTMEISVYRISYGRLSLVGSEDLSFKLGQKSA